MGQALNHQKLIIPGKNSRGAHPGYSQDARAIEMWANEGIVRKLIAGSGVTLNPSSGIDAGLGIEISASGGGGGGTPSLVTLIAGMDTNDYPFGVFTMPTDPSTEGASYWPVWSNSTAAPVLYMMGASWFCIVNGGDSVNLLPTVTVPGFTGGPLTYELYMASADATFTNLAMYRGTITLTTGATVQIASSALSAIPGGTATGDLSLVAGTGDSGNGFVSAAGGISYWCSVVGRIAVPAGTTFT